jgi:hypothetical protein
VIRATSPKARIFRKFGSRAHADAGNHEIGVEGGAAFQPHAIAVYDDSRVLEVEDHAVLLMQGADEVTDLRT